MRFVAEYIVYFIATLVAIVVFVKPITKADWPFITKLAFYAISGVLFISIILFEYFTKTNLSDIVREAIGSTVCRIYPMTACPQEIRRQATAKQPQQPPISVDPGPPLFAPPPISVEPEPQPQFPSPTRPPSGAFACKTTKDQALCEGRDDCTWVAESLGLDRTIKAKAYCRAKPKDPTRKSADLDEPLVKLLPFPPQANPGSAGTLPLPEAGPIRTKSVCNGLVDEMVCKTNETCRWIAARKDATTGKERKAYCRTQAKSIVSEPAK